MVGPQPPPSQQRPHHRNGELKTQRGEHFVHGCCFLVTVWTGAKSQSNGTCTSGLFLLLRSMIYLATESNQAYRLIVTTLAHFQQKSQAKKLNGESMTLFRNSTLLILLQLLDSRASCTFLLQTQLLLTLLLLYLL